MSYPGAELIGFIDANTRHLKEQTGEKPALDIAEDDFVKLPMWEGTHTIHINGDNIEREDDHVNILVGWGNPVTLEEGETVIVDPITYSETRFT